MTDIKEKLPQICSIKITFPVATDEKAIEYKKAISSVIATIPNAKVEFVLLTIPANLSKLCSPNGNHA